MVIENGEGMGREEIEGRLRLVRALAKDRGLDVLLVVGRSFYDRVGNLAYLTNHFPPFPAGAFTARVRGMGHGLLVLPAEGAPVLFVDHPNFRREMVHVTDVRPAADLPAAAAGQIARAAGERGRVGISGEDIMPAAMYLDLLRALPRAEFVSADGLVEALRMRKTTAEADHLRGAARVAQAGYAALFAALRPGVRECDLAAEGHAAGMRAGADFVRYVRVHSGPWAEWGSRWPQATTRRIEAGEIVRFDYVGAFEGYGFDVNRTTVVPGGRPDPRAEALLELAAGATEAAVAAVRAGIRAGELHEVARRFLDAEGNGAGRHLLPAAGHGIGLETVEAPLIQAGEETVLLPEMALCIEPTLHLPGVGGANIEQMVLVEEEGAELLTRFPTRPWREA